MPSLSAKLSRESCMRPSNSSRSRESWITRPEAPMGTGGWADRGLWEACGLAEARFKAVPPSSSREKPRPVERPDGRSRPLHFSTKIGTPSVLTTSYRGATDLKAIDLLQSIPRSEVRVSYDTHRTRLHAKAYLFHRDTGFGTAYVGSANLSRPALTEGLEWTIKLSQYESPHLWDRVAA